MVLTRLQVDGFKNLGGVDLRFGPFTCVAGPNGVGKSNLFDAIGFLAALASRPLAEASGPRRHVAVVPVRTTEAWLLIEEQAIREAAGRPNGRDPLDLPSPARIEDLGDPKATLHQALRTASGRAGRRADRFHPESAHHRLADLVRDWSPLRQLPAFRALEEDARSAMVAVQVPIRSEED